MDGRSGGGVAVRVGGRGDVTGSHTVWTARVQNQIATPVLHLGNIYWVNRGVANCIAAKTGDRLYQARLPGAAAGGSRPGGRDRGGYGGGGGSYASPIIADGKLIVVTRSGLTHVITAADKFELVAQNCLESDNSDFNTPPAVSDGRLLIRSNKAIYCVANTDPN